MTAPAETPVVSWPDEVDEILGRDLVATIGTVTAAKGVALANVEPWACATGGRGRSDSTPRRSSNKRPRTAIIPGMSKHRLGAPRADP